MGRIKFKKCERNIVKEKKKTGFRYVVIYLKFVFYVSPNEISYSVCVCVCVCVYIYIYIYIYRPIYIYIFFFLHLMHFLLLL